MKSLEDQMLEQAGKEMAREVDREILWGFLTELGWQRVMLSRLQDNKHAIDIRVWLDENCKHAYQTSGRDFIFENQQDANWFILRWMS